MAKMIVHCPKCNAHFSVDEVHTGKRARCKRCNTSFVISRPKKTQAPASATQPVQPSSQETIKAAGTIAKHAEDQGVAVRGEAPKVSEQSPDIAKTIAEPVERSIEEIKKEEQDVPIEWEEGQTILDLYEVKQVHTGGGMGLVYRVHHKNWNIDLAVKSPRSGYFKTEQQRESFVKECETWINLGLHPNIVSCYYVRTLGGIPRVFAEYVGGGSLKDWIDNKKLYEGGKEKALERILDVSIQFAWGLQYSHEKDTVHQDVKPANVMMTEEGTAKVTDFGLARARAITGEVTATGSQKSILVSSGGMTPAYCSPEQANKQPLSRKTDIWSWGLSVLEMFAGEVFWRTGQVAHEALDSFLETGPEDEFIPKMPKKLAEFLRQCFRQNPDDRPKDMAEIAQRLKHIFEENSGQKYAHPEPETAELLADGLNNRAASILDLGRKDEAEKFYNTALEIDPHHPEATYNRGLLLWRSGRITDDELIKQIEGLRETHCDDWRDKYLLGLVHLERGDVESAVHVLKVAEKQAPKRNEVQSALQSARECTRSFRQRFYALKDDMLGVTSVAISSDGRLGLSTGGHVIRLWDLENGRCLNTLEGQTHHRISSVHMSPDGHWGLSGTSDKTVLWDLATGQCLRIFEGHTYDVSSVAISPDGSTVISGGWNGAIRLWDLATGQCLRTFEGRWQLPHDAGKAVSQGHGSEVTSVAVIPYRRLALSGSKDRTVRLWDLATGQCLRVLEGHGAAVNSVDISSDGKLGLSGGDDETVKLWDLTTRRCLRMLEGHNSRVTSVAISPDGRLGFSGSGDETVRLWELATGRCLRTFTGHTGYVNSVAISMDGRFGLSGGNDGTVRLWRLDVVCSFRSEHVLCQAIRSEDIFSQQKEFLQLMSVAREQIRTGGTPEAYRSLQRIRNIPGFERHPVVLAIWESLSSKTSRSGVRGCWSLRMMRGHSERVTSVAISSNGKIGLSGSRDWTVRSWNLDSGKSLRTCGTHKPVNDEKMLAFLKKSVAKGHGAAVTSVAISLDGRFGLSGSKDNTVRLWDLASQECLKILQERKSELHSGVASVAISPDGKLALSGSADTTIRLWDLATGRCLRILQGHSKCVTSLCISSDGRLLLSGSEDGTLKLWGLSTGQCLRTLKEEKSSLGVPGAISPDGRLGLSGSLFFTVRLWDLVTGNSLRVFEGHKGLITSVAISPDGSIGISGSTDKTLKLWDLATGQCLVTLEGHSEGVTSVSISPDGRHLLSGSKDKTLRLWYLDWDYEFPEPADWDEGAKAYLEIFLTLHCSCGPDGISRVGKPVWNDDDFRQLFYTLGCAGYGWLRPEGVRKKLEEMTANWQGPPPLPFASPNEPHRPPRKVERPGHQPVIHIPDRKATLSKEPKGFSDNMERSKRRKLLDTSLRALRAELNKQEALLKLLRARQRKRVKEPPLNADRSTTKPARNDPCPCGSGKKFKQCCGKKDSTLRTGTGAAKIKCSCGFENPRDNKFCTHCGKLLSGQ